MLHFSVAEKDLLFVNDGKSFSSRLLVEYSIFDTYSTTHPSDSGSVQFTYLSEKDFSDIVDSFPITYSLKDGSILRLKFKDLNRNAESIRNIVINNRLPIKKKNYFRFRNFLRLLKYYFYYIKFLYNNFIEFFKLK